MRHASHSHSHFQLRDIQQAFSRHATEYDTHAQLQQGVLFNALRELEPQFLEGMTLLDAGCGTGYLMELLRHCEVPFTVMSCDAAFGMCEQAAMRHSEDHENHVACGDITALPYADASCDMAISSLTVQWVDVLETALQEIYRVLKPGGRAVITSFGPMTLQELREAFAAVDKLPHVSDFASVESMAQQAESVGFNVLNTSAEFRNQHYATVRELMQAIRAIGASNKTAGRRKTLTGRHRFSAMEKTYREAYETTRGVPASWEILYLLLQKDE